VTLNKSWFNQKGELVFFVMVGFLGVHRRVRLGAPTFGGGSNATN
jgi:hypothetical protein